jgi:hypothetical protein
MIHGIVIVEYCAMFVVWLTVSVVYWVLTRGRWWRTEEGRLMMADSALFVWITGLTLGAVFFRDYPGRVWVSVFSLGLFTVTGVWRLRVIVKGQRLRRSELLRLQEMQRDLDARH